MNDIVNKRFLSFSPSRKVRKSNVQISIQLKVGRKEKDSKVDCSGNRYSKNDTGNKREVRLQ